LPEHNEEKTMYSHETMAEVAKVQKQCPGTQAAAALQHAVTYQQPLLTAMDALLRAAKDYSERFDSKLADDYVLGPPWLDAIKGVRRLLDGDFGPIDNGTVEAIFWRALAIAGYNERSANL
jgi:hypothetical protein